jgi:hypothetical protein
MNNVERVDRVISLLSQSLDLLARHAQKSIETTLEQEAFDRLVDARDEVRTLRAQLASGAASGTD